MLKDSEKSKQQLIDELVALRKRVSGIKSSDEAEEKADKTGSLNETSKKHAGAVNVISDLSGDEQRHLYIQHLEGMQRIADAISKSLDPETLLLNVLEAVRTNFQVDRAWIIYPCDPQSASCSVPAEATVPEYPGAFSVGEEIPTDPLIIQVFQTALESIEPIPFHTMPPGFEVVEKYSIRSQIVLALKPRFGKPWLLGMHQCDYQRTWTDDEQWLFKETGRRIEDLLSSIYLQRKLKESEELYRHLVENSPEIIYSFSDKAGGLYYSPRVKDVLGYSPEYLSKHPYLWHDSIHSDDLPMVDDAISALKEGKNFNIEYQIRDANGDWLWFHDRNIVSLLFSESFRQEKARR